MHLCRYVVVIYSQQCGVTAASFLAGAGLHTHRALLKNRGWCSVCVDPSTHAFSIDRWKFCPCADFLNAGQDFSIIIKISLNTSLLSHWREAQSAVAAKFWWQPIVKILEHMKAGILKTMTNEKQWKMPCI